MDERLCVNLAYEKGKLAYKFFLVPGGEVRQQLGEAGLGRGAWI
jgi:hypothetical protein